MKNKLKRLLLSERGDSSYISSFVYILVAVILIAFIINVFHIISVKQEMDHIADQIVKQIQLNGGTSGDTDALFSFLSSQMSEVDGLSYQVSGPGNTVIDRNTPRYPSANTLVSFIFRSTFLFLPVSGGIFIQPLMRAKPSWAFLATKKEWPS